MIGEGGRPAGRFCIYLTRAYSKSVHGSQSFRRCLSSVTENHNQNPDQATALLLHAHSITSSLGRAAEIIFAISAPCVWRELFSGFSPVVSHQKHMGWFSNCVGAGSTTDEEQRLRGELSRLRSENRSLRERLGESSSASPREYGDAASSIIRGGDRRPSAESSVDKERREEIEKERRLSLGEVPIILRADHVVQGASYGRQRCLGLHQAPLARPA